jgi:hypothetical protein
MYLSVDLDYWKEHDTPTAANVFFRRLLSLKKRMYVVRNHQQLIKHIKAFPPKDDILVNVDYHSDIIEGWNIRSTQLTCANWVNYVPFRKRGHFIWLYPDFRSCVHDAQGLCGNMDLHAFGDDDHQWRKLSRRQGIHHIDYDAIESIGIALSPGYSEMYPIRTVVSWLFGVPEEKISKYFGPNFSPVTVRANHGLFKRTHTNNGHRS